MKLEILGGVVIALLVSACSKSEKSGATNREGDVLPRQGGCDSRTKNNICVDYFGQPDGPKGITPSAKAACEQAGGTVVEMCSTEEALGRCISAEIRIQQMLFYPPLTKEKAEQMCGGMGNGKLGPAAASG